MTERLALLGQEPGDIETFSALLQDATLRLADVGYDRKARRLALLVNRYRREVAAPSRIRSALRVETVGAVQRSGWPNDCRPAKISEQDRARSSRACRGTHGP